MRTVIFNFSMPAESVSLTVPLLSGASICGVTHLADHFSMTVDPAAFNLAYLAITSPSGVANVAQFNKAECTFLIDDVL
ncbi:hypothetical protein RQP46_009534 [Phenoliferia psychrophenolica]